MKKSLFFTLFTFGFSFSTLIHAQIITTIAGNGIASFSGDGGPATAAELNVPIPLVADGNGNIYIGDFVNQRIRKVNTSGIISTVAGTGTAGYSGDGGPATAADLNYPRGIDIDTAGNIYISDESNERIRKVNTSGIISTIVGNGTSGFSGDGGQASVAELNTPEFLAIDRTGNLYIADQGNQRVRMVNTSGIISTYAGNGTSGFSGDGGPATAAEFNIPVGLAVDGSNNLYIADYSNDRIRKVDNTGKISTFAGTGIASFSGDGGQATGAEINTPQGVCVDRFGNVYIADYLNYRVRMVIPTGIISTIAGTGTGGFSGDGGPATAADLLDPTDVAADAAGDLYIADAGNERIRKLTGIPLGINKTGLLNESVFVYPNPSNGKFTVQLPVAGSQKLVFEVYNMLGEKVYTQSLMVKTSGIDLSDKPAGIYLYRIITETENLVSAGKLVLEK